MIFKGCPHYVHDTKYLLTKKLRVSFHSFPLKDEVWFCQLDIRSIDRECTVSKNNVVFSHSFYLFLKVLIFSPCCLSLYCFGCVVA